MPPGARPPGPRRPMPTYGAPRRHRSRLPIVLLLLASLAVGAYFLLGRHSGSGSGSSQGFVATSQNLVTAADNVPMAAEKVQRFLELHTFDNDALKYIGEMQVYLDQLESIAKQSSGSQRQIADAQVTAAKQAITAATQFRQAVAFTYKLSGANAAEQTLNLALAGIEHNIKAWNQA
jgi:hypothetical protein